MISVDGPVAVAANNITVHACAIIDNEYQYYLGEVNFIPPLSTTSLKFSRSLGAVAISAVPNTLNFNFVYVKDIYNFDINVGDTICRAMGFTHAVRNSVMTQNNTEYSFNLSTT